MFTVASEKKVGEIVEKAETKKGWMYPTWNEVEAYGFPNELGHFVSCIGEESNQAKHSKMACKSTR